MTARVQLKKISRESQVDLREDELIGGKLAAVNYL
jgi:hypothetical protein